MKRIFFTILIFSGIIFADAPSGIQLLNKMISMMNQKNAKAVMTQTIETSSGATRTFEYDSFISNDGKNSLMRYKKPSRVRGNAILMTDYSDNIWSYNQRTRRVRKLASHAKKQKFEGSDFTYEDMSSGDSWKKDYTPKFIKTVKINGNDCYKVKLTKKNNDISYSKLVCFIRVSDFFPIQIDYYDGDKKLLKSLYLQDIQKVENILTPMKMVMKNHQENTQTTMEYKSITYDVNFNKRFFTSNNMK
ncbi:MAG: outer membrane lipoprotein-sorting protein [Bacteroidota bacterium]|nr:outer membrane lipoprotein-sorting protein [Bacteroidota bacterium]